MGIVDHPTPNDPAAIHQVDARRILPGCSCRGMQCWMLKGCADDDKSPRRISRMMRMMRSSSLRRLKAP